MAQLVNNGFNSHINSFELTLPRDLTAPNYNFFGLVSVNSFFKYLKLSMHVLNLILILMTTMIFVMMTVMMMINMKFCLRLCLEAELPIQTSPKTEDQAIARETQT